MYLLLLLVPYDSGNNGGPHLYSCFCCWSPSKSAQQGTPQLFTFVVVFIGPKSPGVSDWVCEVSLMKEQIELLTEHGCTVLHSGVLPASWPFKIVNHSFFAHSPNVLTSMSV